MLLTQQQILPPQQHDSWATHTQRAVFSDISFGFMPAFKDLRNEQIHLSVDQQGELSVMHMIDHLPDQWVDERDDRGRPVSLKAGIIAGFMRNGQFYTLRQLMGQLHDS